MTFNELVANIKKFEGFRHIAYDDMRPNKPITSLSQLKGTLTIGYGRTTNVKIGDTTTKEKEDDWMDKAVKSYYDQVISATKSYNYNFTENQLYALTDFTYNCGRGNLLQLINFGKRSKQEIGDKILLYNKSGGKELAGLTKRRQWENKLYFNNEETEEKPCYTECIFEFQAELNHLIKEYDLPVDKIVTDGIWGNKTNSCLNSIVSIITS